MQTEAVKQVERKDSNESLLLGSQAHILFDQKSGLGASMLASESSHSERSNARPASNRFRNTHRHEEKGEVIYKLSGDKMVNVGVWKEKNLLLISYLDYKAQT